MWEAVVSQKRGFPVKRGLNPMPVIHHFPGCHNVATLHDIRLDCIVIHKKCKESNRGKHKNVQLVTMNLRLQEVMHV